MTVRALIRVASVSVLLMPMVVTSTPPRPAPINGFVLEGTVQRAGAGSLENFTVIPLAWAEGHRIGICRGLEDYLINRQFALTSSEGKFYIDFCTCSVPDTLSVAVISPDTMITGTIVPMESLRGAYQGIDDEYTTGGDGCNDSPTTVRYTVGYIFSARNLVISVP